MAFAIDIATLSVVLEEESDLEYLDQAVEHIKPVVLEIGELACILAARVAQELGMKGVPTSGWNFAFTTKELAASFNRRLSREVGFDEMKAGQPIEQAPAS